MSRKTLTGARGESESPAAALMNAERMDAESGKSDDAACSPRQKAWPNLPGREQAPDIIDDGAERAGHKPGADQADHERGFHPVDRPDQMSLVEIKPGKVCHRRHP